MSRNSSCRPTGTISNQVPVLKLCIDSIIAEYPLALVDAPCCACSRLNWIKIPLNEIILNSISFRNIKHHTSQKMKVLVSVTYLWLLKREGNSFVNNRENRGGSKMQFRKLMMLSIVPFFRMCNNTITYILDFFCGV